MGVCCGEGGGEEAGVGKVGLVGGTVTPLHYNGTLYETAHFGSRFLVRKVRYVWPYDPRDYNIIITKGRGTLNIIMTLQSPHYPAAGWLIQIFSTCAGLVKFTFRQYFLWLDRFLTYLNFKYTRLPHLYLAFRVINIVMASNQISTLPFMYGEREGIGMSWTQKMCWNGTHELQLAPSF